MIQMARILATFSLCILAGCAYQFGPGERHIPGDYTEIAIPVFKNSTQAVGIEGYFTNALVREFSRSKIAKVVSKNEAPVVIEGVIERVEYKHGGRIDGNDEDADNKISIPDNTVLTTDYRVYVDADIKVIRTSDRKILWNGKIKNERNYTAPQVGLAGINSVNPLYNHSARMDVIQALAQDMMAEGYDRITENF
jgi:hypothetical protein